MGSDEDAGDRCTNATDEKELCEFSSSPQLFKVRSEHIQREHVEQNVKKAAMQKDVGDKLPQVQISRHHRGREAEVAGNRRSSRKAVEDLEKEDDGTCQDDRLDGRSPTSAESNTGI